MEDLLPQALKQQEAKLRELNQKLAEFRAIQEERDKVHALVSQMRFNLGMPPFGVEEKALEIRLEVSDSLQLSDEQPPLWMGAQSVLEGSLQPMSVLAIVSALIARGYKLAGRSGVETVRAALNRKKEVFKKIGAKYDLVVRKATKL